MSTLTVQSVANNGAAGVFTKPSGLAVGDLMIVAIHSNYTGTFSDPGGSWSEVGPITMSGGNDATISIFYKVADSGDVAASTFTFNHSNGAASENGVIMRVTNARTTSVLADSFASSSASLATSHSYSVGIDPATTDCLLVSLVAAADNDAFVLSDVAYTPTTSLTNARIESGAFSIDYAIQTDEVDITTVTFSTDVTADGGIVMAAFRPNHPESGTADLFQTGASFFAPATSGGVSVTSALHEVSPTFPAPTSYANSPSNWTNPDKPSTNWTNPDKP